MNATLPPAGPTGADAVTSALRQFGVDVVFGLPGAHNLSLWASLVAADDLRLVGVRHEQTAGYAADGYARATGRPGVALTTTGPGAANAVAAIGEAWASGSPVVMIATDIPVALRRSDTCGGVLHETPDQAQMFAQFTKATFRLDRVEDLERGMGDALRLAVASPAGPVFVEIPTDVLVADASHAQSTNGRQPLTTGASEPIDDLQLRTAVDMIMTAQRPLIWAGGGALRGGAGPALCILAERLGAPILETYGARGIAGPSHPGWVGLPPHAPAAGELWDCADLVIAIGSDLDGMMTQNWRMPQPPQLLAINLDAADATKNYKGFVLEADARTACEALNAGVPARTSGWDIDLPELRAQTWASVAEDEPLAETLLGGLPVDAFIAADMCIPGYWIAGFHRFAHERLLAYPVGWGTLGFGFPASIGAACADDTQTICVCGDGGFLFACGELATVAEQQLPLTIVLFDDGGYGMLRFDQQTADQPSPGIDLLRPDWVMLAQSFGIRAQRLTSMERFAETFAEHAALAQPTMLIVDAALKPPLTTSPRWYRVTQDRPQPSVPTPTA